MKHLIWIAAVLLFAGCTCGYPPQQYSNCSPCYPGAGYVAPAPVAVQGVQPVTVAPGQPMLP